MASVARWLRRQVLGKAMLAYYDDAKEFATVGGADLFNNADFPSMIRYRTPAEVEAEHCANQNTPAQRPSQVS